jgi:hypothetical protein
MCFYNYIDYFEFLNYFDEFDYFKNFNNFISYYCEYIKRCSKCREYRKINLFATDNNRKDKLCPQCKVCQAEYRQENKEYIKEYDAKFRQNNREKINKNKRIFYQNNKNRIAEGNAIYYQNNKEKISDQKKEYYQENKEQILETHNEYTKIKSKTDPIFRLRKIISVLIGKALKSNDSNKNNISCLKFLPYTLEELKTHIEKQFELWMNWENQGIYKIKEWKDDDQSTWKWNLDHLIPQSHLPYASMEDDNFKKCWALSNLRPLNAKQNISEAHRRTPEQIASAQLHQQQILSSTANKENVT